MINFFGCDLYEVLLPFILQSVNSWKAGQVNGIDLQIMELPRGKERLCRGAGWWRGASAGWQGSSGSHGTMNRYRSDRWAAFPGRLSAHVARRRTGDGCGGKFITSSSQFVCFTVAI